MNTDQKKRNYMRERMTYCRDMLSSLRDQVPQIDGAAKISEQWIKAMEEAICQLINVYVMSIRHSGRTKEEIEIDVDDLSMMVLWWADEEEEPKDDKPKVQLPPVRESWKPEDA